MPCLETAIGLSRTVCNCFEDTVEDYDVSDSGYYIDETEGMNLEMAGAQADCATGGIWDVLTRARESAINDLKGDLLVQLGTHYKKTIESMAYTIGSQKYTTVYNPGTFYAGVRLVPNQVRNGIITITTIKLLFDTSILVQCSLFNNLSDTPIETFSVNCTANRPSESAVLNYELPMFVSGEAVEYYLVYELPAVARPLQNKIVCSSCTGWNVTCCPTACFGNRHNKAETWNNNLMIGGIKGDTWEDLDEQTGIGNLNNGIILNITMNCDYEDLICQNMDYGLGQLMNATGKTIAKALQYRAAWYTLSSLLTTGNVSRLNMTNREEIVILKSTFKSEYDKRVLWLSQNMDTSNNGCYYCESNMFKGGILI